MNSVEAALANDPNNTMRRTQNVIKLNDPNLSNTIRSTKSASRSRAQSPEFSYLKSGLDDFHSSSSTNFRDLNARSPHRRGSPQTQSHHRYNAKSPPPATVVSTTSVVHVNQQMKSPIRMAEGGQPQPPTSRVVASSTAPTVSQMIVTPQEGMFASLVFCSMLLNSFSLALSLSLFFFRCFY